MIQATPRRSGGNAQGPPLVWSGKGSEAAPVLDRLLYDGRFDESDICVVPGGKAISIAILVPAHDERRPAAATRRRRLGRTYEVPLYRHVVEIAGALSAGIQDKSQTYTHRLFSVRYSLSGDRLMFDASPAFKIEVSGVSGTVVEVFRNLRSTEMAALRTFGPIEYE